MEKWNDPSEKMPKDGTKVEIRIVGGEVRGPVEFAAGRFWKARRKIGGQAYPVEAWREIDPPKRPETKDPVFKMSAEKDKEVADGSN